MYNIHYELYTVTDYFICNTVLNTNPAEYNRGQGFRRCRQEYSARSTRVPGKYIYTTIKLHLHNSYT